MKKKETRQIPRKNYIIVVVVCLLVVLFTLYIRKLYLNGIQYKNSTSVFSDQKINQINIDDLDYSLSETNEAILYIGFTGSKDIYNMEKKLYRVLKKYNILDKTIYFDVTDYQKDSEYIKLLKERFPNLKNKMVQAPSLIYFRDGNAVEIKSSIYKSITADDLEELILKYGIE